MFVLYISTRLWICDKRVMHESMFGKCMMSFKNLHESGALIIFPHELTAYFIEQGENFFYRLRDRCSKLVEAGIASENILWDRCYSQTL